jgi:hypothetical protein
MCQQSQLPKRQINQIQLTHKENIQNNAGVITFLTLNVAYNSNRMGLYKLNGNSHTHAQTE